MGITNTIFKVMVSGYGSILLIISLWITLTTASICKQGKQYLNTKLQQCVNCTECATGDVVLRPCEVHRDTICGPISELLKFVQQPSDFDSNPHRHQHRHQGHRKTNSANGGGGGGGGSDIVWKYGDDVVSSNSFTSTEAPFNSAETLIWDWQAVALTSAVFVCILFFLVITLYSLHQAKQWRRLKDNFEADVEELSARLSLMAAASSPTTTTNEKGEILEPRLGPINDGNYLNNRCVYLEQLLNGRKNMKISQQNGGGNVYIEETNNRPSATINQH